MRNTRGKKYSLTHFMGLSHCMEHAVGTKCKYRLKWGAGQTEHKGGKWEESVENAFFLLSSIPSVGPNKYTWTVNTLRRWVVTQTSMHVGFDQKDCKFLFQYLSEINIHKFGPCIMTLTSSSRCIIDDPQV